MYREMLPRPCIDPLCRQEIEKGGGARFARVKQELLIG